MEIVTVKTENNLIDLGGNVQELPIGEYGYIKYPNTIVIYKPNLWAKNWIIYLHATPESFEELLINIRNNIINDILNGR